MTLRLTNDMESELESLAYDRRLSKAGTIRQMLRRGIAQAYGHGTQDEHLQAQGGAR